MSDPILLGDGAMADVTVSFGVVTVVWKAAKWGPVCVWRSDGSPVRELAVVREAPSDDNTFPKLLTWRLRSWLAYRAWRNGEWQAVILELMPDAVGSEWCLGRCAGNHPLAWSSDGWLGWQDDRAGVVHGVSLETGEAKVLRAQWMPDGIARLEGERVVFINEARFEVPGMLNPVSADVCTVGEGPDGGLAVRLGARQGFVLAGDCMTPRVAVTWGGPGVRLVVFTEADITAPVIEAPRIGRPLWYGFFTGSPDAPENWRTSTPPQSLPGNCYLNVADGIVYTMDGRQVAQYVAAEQPGQKINEEVAKARLRHPTLPVIPYWTRQDHAGPVPDGDWIGVEAYQQAGEPDAAFEARIVTAARRCKAVAYIPGCYTSNPNNTTTLETIPPAVARATMACRNVVATFPFSGTGRATGLWQHPEVLPAWQAFGAGVTTPEIVVIDPHPTKPQEPHVPRQVPDSTTISNDDARALFRRLEAAYRANPSNAQTMIDVPTAPNGEWGFFQAQRFFGRERWDAADMLADVAKEVP
jgi:hypothetical protein